MMALCLAREDAVEGWREMLGPKEIPVAAESAPDRCVMISLVNSLLSMIMAFLWYFVFDLKNSTL